MVEFRRTPLYRGVFVVAVTAIGLLLSLLLHPLLDPDFLLVFLAGVLASAWFYGLSGGIAATVLSLFALRYFFLTPSFSLSIPSWNVFARLLFFTLLALAITWLAAAGRRSHGMLAATLTSIGDAVIATDKNGGITFMNSVAEALTGWRQAEAKAKPLVSVLRLIHANSREPVEDPVAQALQAQAAVSVSDHALLISRDGTEISIEESAAPVRDESGRLRGVILVLRDVTGRKHLEEQLGQSQKMDAVGRLASGVAGDFNNLLTVITGYSELLRSELPLSNPLRRFAEEILYAGERAATLTRQLLAFGQGQAAQPKLLDLNVLLAGMEPMLRRLLGQNNELIILPDPNLGRVHMDPAQFEQVVMHVANNARDAMPSGGKLVLETSNVEMEDANSRKVGVAPGSYVMLAVSDTGVGMDADTRSRLFEPFFTTKQKGKGTGLGLSIVYGIIKQSGGQITVYSQMGCGTIFEIYLPRVKEPVAPPAQRTLAPPKGSETILLVDDEDGVRRLVQAILQSNGYSVIDAASGGAALAAFEKNAHKIDMVLTDVVMPQMDGFELGERLAEKNPALKVLFMSGYRDSPIASPAGQPPRPFLHKPFTPDTLLAKVRETLDARSVG